MEVSFTSVFLLFLSISASAVLAAPQSPAAAPRTSTEEGAAPKIEAAPHNATKPVPQVAEAFSYKSEIIQPKSKLLPINILKTDERWFNSREKLGRIDCTPLANGTITDLCDDAFGINPLSIVHDFNTGHAYVMDKVIGNCTITKIESSIDNEHVKDPQGHDWVRQLNASEFFDLTGAKFVYEGRDSVGDVDVDVWKARRDDWPPEIKDQTGIGMITWWTWKFLADEWTEMSDNEGDTKSSDVPYQLELGVEMTIAGSQATFNYTINYYDFTTAPPLDWDYDVRPCWSEFKERAMFFFYFESKHADVIKYNLPKVKEMILLSVRRASWIPTSLRLTQPRLNFKKDDFGVEEVLVEMEILGPPPIPGNVKPIGGFQPSLEESMYEIAKWIEAGNFTIDLVDPESLDKSTTVKVKHGWYRIFTPDGDHNHTDHAHGGHSSHYPCHPRKIKPDDQPSGLPKLYDKYQAVVELKDAYANEMVRFREYYDYEHNHGRIDLLKNGTAMTALFDYENDEVLEIISGFCFAVKPEESKLISKIFPFVKLKDGHDHIAGVKTIFDFANEFKEIRLANEMVRGIEAEHYLACVHHEEFENITASVDWWFSSPKETMPLGPKVPRIPLQMTITGVSVTKTHSVPIDLRYTFVDFIPGGPEVGEDESDLMEDETDLFETPPGMICVGKKNLAGRKPPKSPPAFSYKARVTQPESMLDRKNMIKSMETYYNFKKQVTRIDQRSIAGEPGIEGAPSGHSTRDVHDFNTGIAYRQDLVTGDCKIEPIHDSITDSQESVDANGHKVVSMVNASNFFHLDENYQYVGKRKDENGVLMDVWITKKENWPPKSHNNNSYTTIFEWSFLDPSWMELSDDEANSNATNVPFHLYLRLDLRVGGSSSDILWYYDYDIIDFRPTAPPWTDFDISLCYDQFEMAHFIVAFPGNHSIVVQENMPVVKEMLLFSIGIWGDIETDLRVSNIEFDFIKENKTNGDEIAKVIAIFTILDVAPVKGDPDHVQEQKKLVYIIDKLRKAVDAGSFVVFGPDPQNADETVEILKAIPGSLEEVDRWDEFAKGPKYGPKSPGLYTTGEIVGIGIGVTIFGLIIGIVLGVFIFKKKNADLPISFAFRKDTGHGDKIKIVDTMESDK